MAESPHPYVATRLAIRTEPGQWILPEYRNGFLLWTKLSYTWTLTYQGRASHPCSFGVPTSVQNKKNRKKTKKFITAAVFVVAAAAVQNKKKFDSHANRLDFWLDFATK